MKKQDENTNFMVPEMKKKNRLLNFELYRIEKLTAATTCSLTVDLSLG